MSSKKPKVKPEAQIQPGSEPSLPYAIRADLQHYIHTLAGIYRTWWPISAKQEVALAGYYALVLQAYADTATIEQLVDFVRPLGKPNLDAFSRNVLMEVVGILTRFQENLS